uniref:Uncharacterized protein n=1 Tax=Monopterus albus TaxID=43700 RepID=A0A3Q3JQ09_MONAL
MEEVTRLVSTGDCVKIWDVVSMAPLEQFNPHSISHPVAQACWSSNNQYLVSASSSGDKLVVSSLKSTPVPMVELAEGKKQTRVCLNSTSQFLVSGGLDHSVHIWDLKTKRLHRSLKDHREEVTCVSFNANDSCIASGSTSGDLVVYSLTTNLSSKAFGHGSNQPIHDLRLSMLKRSLLGTVSDSGTVVLWDSNTQKELHVFNSAHKAPGSGLTFSPASELLVVSVGLDKKIVCYDTASKIVLRSIQVDSPLTAVDFTLDGTGLVVGSTQGKIYQYDLRKTSAPTRITVAHKTSVSCLRFQSGSSRHKVPTDQIQSSQSEHSGRRTASTKRSSAKQSSSQQDPTPSTDPTPPRQVTGTGQYRSTGAEGMSREAEGQQGTEQYSAVEKFSSVGRNSLDIFSPARDDCGGDFASLEMLSREGEGQQVIGRSSLDIFSPVKEVSHTFVMVMDVSLFTVNTLSSASPHRKTPLVASAGRCLSPLSIFQTPPPIEEEEALPAAQNETSDKASGSHLEGDAQTSPASSQQTSHSQPALPFFTPEPSLRRANGMQAQLSYDTPVQRAPPTSTAAGPVLSAVVSSSLSQNIAEVVGQGGAAPLTSLQIHFIQNMIQETLDDFRDTCHKDIVNLQIEMIRQFYIQLVEIHSLIEKYSVNESLVEEIEKLREENRRLKANF